MEMRLTHRCQIFDHIGCRYRSARLGCAISYHAHGAHCAAWRGDHYRWLTHLEYQARYLQERIAVRGGPFDANDTDRTELCLLLARIAEIEPIEGDGHHAFNTKLRMLKATYGRLTRPPEPRYGIHYT